VGNEGILEGVGKKMSLAEKVAGFYCCYEEAIQHAG
jgi:hypothetical protein